MIKPLKKFVRWLTKKMPKRLYARSLIIIIAPMVLLQTVIGYIFMERHWPNGDRTSFNRCRP